MKLKMTFIVRVVLIMLPIFVAIWCIGIGRYSISFVDSFAIFFKMLLNDTSSINPQVYSVIINIRLPRIILALVCGGGLAVAGTAFQALFTNPLATPDTLGVSSGASFGASLAILLGLPILGIQGLALLCGLIAVFITYRISVKNGQASIIMVVLSGMVVSSMFGALVSLAKYVADPEVQLPAITFWLLGSLSGVNYKILLFGVPPIIAGIAVIFMLRWKLNLVALPEDEAKSLGVSIRKMRLYIVISATLITGAAVAMCGQVGWVGLLIPHITRMIFGSNNKHVVPASISFGATFMVIIDTIARSATTAEIPISILTALIGAPFFIILLRKTRGIWL